MVIKVRVSRQIISVKEEGIFWGWFIFVWKMQLSMLDRYMVTFIASLFAIKLAFRRHLKIKCTVMTINLQQTHALIKKILNQNIYQSGYFIYPVPK